jgi:hypothetical protein
MRAELLWNCYNGMCPFKSLLPFLSLETYAYQSQLLILHGLNSSIRNFKIFDT